MSMYKISKSGLWYKVHKLFNTTCFQELRRTGRVSGCGWFWSGLTATLVLPIVTVFACVACLAVLAIVVNLLAFLSTALTGHVFCWVDIGLVAISLAISSVFSIFYGFHLLMDGKIVPQYLKREKKTSTRKVKKESLLAAYWKAFKSKYCPVFELEE